MQPTDKFRTDLDHAARRAAGRGEAAEIEALRDFFFRSFPKVGREAMSALFATYLERRRSRPDTAVSWLAGISSVLMMDYDGTPFDKSDWEELREAIVLEEEDLDMELLEYVMALVVDHRGIMSLDGVGEWFEDEEFWTAYAPIMFDEARWAEVPAVIDAIERLVRPAPGAAVLDACCGPGRHSLELAARGYRVTGIDITEPYLEAARESANAWGFEDGARAQGGSARFLHADLREFTTDAPFDFAINLYTSFGYFADPAEDRKALARLRLALKPGGVLVLETTGKETAARDFTAGESFDRGGWGIRTEYSIVGAWEGLRNRWILSRGSEFVDRSFVLRLYSGTEMKASLLEAGFSSVSIFGGVDGCPYDQAASSLVALAIA